MRKFKWVEVEHRTDDINHSYSLVEILDGNKVQFWASIHLYPNPEYKYEFVAWSADRKQLMQCKPDADSIDEAQKEIMKYMKKHKVITKKDTVINERL